MIAIEFFYQTDIISRLVYRNIDFQFQKRKAQQSGL